MRALISQRVLIDRHGTACDLLEEGYVTCFQKAGIELRPVTNFASPSLDALLSRHTFTDAVILTGGNDVDPRLYGAATAEGSEVSNARDETEGKLLDFAIARRLPVLGVCRGMQFLNVHFGGSLVADVERDLGIDHAPAKEHSILITHAEASRYFDSGEWTVNSFHRKAVTPDRLAAPLRAFATTTDGRIVEGLYHPSLPIAGVQFHPERPMTGYGLGEKLVKAFREGLLFWNQNR